MPGEMPELDLESSVLLRSVLDGTTHQVWEFWGDGEYPFHRDLKDEVDRLVAQVLRTWSKEQLAELASSDSWARAGLADAGRPLETAPDPEAHRRRRMALRVVELAVAETIAKLEAETRWVSAPGDRAFRSVPGLWDQLSERDGLFALRPHHLPEEFVSHDPVLFLGDYALHPHPDLRGARELYWKLYALSHLEELTVKIALDPLRVLPRENVSQQLLLDYWFGVRITRQNLDSLAESNLGRTVHYRTLGSPEADALEATFPLLATEFDWSVRDPPVKTLQIEEVRPTPSRVPADGLVVNRYLHSRRDTDAKQWVHLDGALKGYPVASYAPRRNADPVAARGKAGHYRKLWRVDGPISDEVWGMLVGQYYRQNELIAEHLGELVDERPPAS